MLENRPTFRRGYTLTEVLVVVAVIVLLLGTSVPVFKALTGNRSVDAAANVVGGALGEARAEAIALQRVTGLFFFEDRISGRVNAALVRSNGQSSTSGSPSFTYHLLDLVPDRDFIALPPGVGIQFVDNCNVDRTQVNRPRQDDGYVGLNQHPSYNGNPDADNNTFDVRYGGVILFDPRGQLISLQYAFDYRVPDPSAPNRFVESPICRLFNGSDQSNIAPSQPEFIPRDTAGRPPQSQFGFVLYDAEPFRTLSLTPGDPQLSGRAYDNNEQQEERWLDENGLPFLVNRYNGTLIRGE